MDMNRQVRYFENGQPTLEMLMLWGALLTYVRELEARIEALEP